MANTIKLKSFVFFCDVTRYEEAGCLCPWRVSSHATDIILTELPLHDKKNFIEVPEVLPLEV
jgi:hypothetical protein